MTELEAQKTEYRPDLQAKIMKRIAQRERRILILKTAGFGVLFAGSTAFLVMSYFNLTAALAQSGFFSFFSLFFSDFSAAMANFQDFAFSILESFPVFSAAFLVGGLMVVIWSATHFIDDLSHIHHERILQTS